jgi:hypothetical protein
VTGPAATAVSQLYQAKLILLSASRIRLLFMTLAFYCEAGAVVVAVVLTLVAAAGR